MRMRSCFRIAGCSTWTTVGGAKDKEVLEYAVEAFSAENSGRAREPYVRVSRGEQFSAREAPEYFAKAFPTLFPFGLGGPRQVEQTLAAFGAREGDREGVESAGIVKGKVTPERWARYVLRRHGGRFARHPIFAFLVFNMGMQWKNGAVSRATTSKRGFDEVDRIVQSLTREQLERARVELETSNRTDDADVNRLLRQLSTYGYRQPFSREERMTMRRKIKSLIMLEGIPAIWFTVNPNDQTNPINLRMATHRFWDGEGEAERLLQTMSARVSTPTRATVAGGKCGSEHGAGRSGVRGGGGEVCRQCLRGGEWEGWIGRLKWS
ncbi:hypothetical protein MPH_13470 [Macrophomina phaseolina MS6]|uniref:Helitron helicase-like domain-containing protein n=1 Tax=Macrophomina phaseolina (strain MS6) TaxID=1126212 RepID=K2R9E5_MACPH|nr:hypothetical protein MPH_13470 [Macrophomina phaseolina MS6]